MKLMASLFHPGTQLEDIGKPVDKIDDLLAKI
jgi:hypothetical protein